jgi:hypothetical protein
VSLEDILRTGFCKGVCNLILGSNWENLDKPVPYVFAKVIVTYVDVLGTRVKLWKPCEFQCTRVVFKNLAVYVGLGTDNLKTDGLFFWTAPPTYRNTDFINEKNMLGRYST